MQNFPCQANQSSEIKSQVIARNFNVIPYNEEKLYEIFIPGHLTNSIQRIPRDDLARRLFIHSFRKKRR